MKYQCLFPEKKNVAKLSHAEIAHRVVKAKLKVCFGLLTLVLLNKLRCHVPCQFLDNQIT